MKPPSIDAEFVLAHQGYVKRLARSLVFDEARADDLAQEVWLSALAHPPADGGALRGWLATVARNLASLARRGEERRRARERESAAPESVAAADELLQRESVRARLVQAVLGLDEPFRETLILRYFEELPPRAIAARQRVSVATVKSRLKRGLAGLRERLDRESGARAAWSLAFVHGLQVGPGPLGLAACGVHSLATGVLLMTTTKKLAVLVASIAALLLTWRFAAPDASPAAPDELSRGALAALPEPEAAPEAAAPSAVPAERERVSNVIRVPGRAPRVSQGIDTGDLDVLVELREGHVPLPGVLVSVTPWNHGGILRFGQGAPSSQSRTARTDAQGHALLVGLAPGDVEIETDRGSEGVSGHVRAGAVQSVKVALRDTCDVAGRVVDSQGLPVLAAEVWFATRGAHSLSGSVATTGADGRFEVRGVRPSSVYAFARKPGSAPSARKFLRANAGARVELELALRGAGAAVLGVVRDDGGALLPDALVTVGPRSRPVESAALAGRPELLDGTLARTDAEGRFALDGLLPGAAWIECSAPGFLPRREPLDLVAGTLARHDLRLGRGAALHGVVSHADGRPAEGTEITVRSKATGRSEVALADGAGNFRLEGLEPGDARALANYRLTERFEADLVLRDGEDAAWDPRLEAGLDLLVRVLDESGKATKRVSVRVECGVEGREPFAQAGQWEESGVFRAAGCPDAPCRVLVYPSDSQLFALAEVRDVRPGGPELVVRLAPGARPSVYLKGRVVGLDGEALAGCDLTTIAPALDWAVHELAQEDGSFRCGPFPAGDWSLEIAHPGFATFRAGPRELAAGATWELGTIRLQRGEVLALDLVYPPEEAQHFPPSIVVQGLDSDIAEWCKVEGARGTSPQLAPGRYELQVEGAYAAQRQTVDVRAGRENRATVVLQPGIAFRVRTRGIDVAARTSVRVLGPAGEVVLERGAHKRRSTEFTLPVCLAPGNYRVSASDSNGREAAQDVVVDAALAQGTVDLEFR